VEAKHSRAPADQGAPRDRGREANVREFIPRPPLPRPHDGYYEWRQIGKHKQPYRITLKTGEAFAMAEIYAREPTAFETAEKNPVNFAILTTKANEAVSHIHERMPVILPLGRKKEWPQPNPTGAYFLPPFPAELLTSYPVTPKMNRALFNDPEATRPLERRDTDWPRNLPHLDRYLRAFRSRVKKRGRRDAGVSKRDGAGTALR
jgi:SOS response associated peptidase (SRAP)